MKTNIVKIITPSLISTFVCVVIALGFVGYRYFHYGYVGSDESIQVQSIHTGDIDDNPLVARYQAAYDSVTSKDILPNFSLFAFWSLLGLLVYYGLAALIKGFTDAEYLKQELEYVHIDRKTVIRTALQRFGIRLAALIVWLIYVKFLFSRIVPQAGIFTLIGSQEPTIIQKIIYAISATVILTLGLYGNVIFARLVALRTRLLSD